MGTLLFVSTALTVFALEFFVKIVAPQQIFSQIRRSTLPCFQESDIMTLEYRPGCSGVMESFGRYIPVAINALGLRDLERSEKRAARGLLVGNSFIFGFGVEQTDIVGAVLEKDMGIEVVSAGFLNSGPDVFYVYTTQKGVALHPDFVIVALYPTNDLIDIGATIWKEEDGNVLSAKHFDTWVDDKGNFRGGTPSWNYRIPVLRDSHLMQLVTSQMKKLVLRAQHVLTRLLRSGVKQDTQSAEYQRCLESKGCIHSFEMLQWRIQRVLALFKTFSSQNHLPVLFVIIPDVAQVTGEKPEDTLFHRALQQEQLPFLDLLSPLRESGFSVEELYFPDGHWTPRGHQVAAHAIADTLYTQGVVE